MTMSNGGMLDSDHVSYQECWESRRREVYRLRDEKHINNAEQTHEGNEY